MNRSATGAVVIIAIAAHLAGCGLFEPPGYRANIFGNQWSVESAGDRPLAREYTFELSVDKFVLSAACGTVAGAFTMDTDGAALYFFDVDRVPVTCPDEMTAIVSALAGVESWSVESEDRIYFHGDSDIALLRAGS